jgi:D-3-phosphoglycerate dehydrogenase
MARPLVAIADLIDPEGESLAYLRSHGVRLVVGSGLWERPELPEAELLELVSRADAIVGGARERFTRQVLESCTRTRCVVKWGIGTDRIDDRAATELGIVVVNTPVVEATRSVAEHTLALMLALVRRLQDLRRRARQGEWRIGSLADGPDDLFGRTVGIIGLGRIGTTVARMLAPFGVSVIAYDPYRDQAWAASVGAVLVPLDELLERSDIVTLHVPATSETRGMIDRGALSRLRPGAYLVNTSRGVVVDTEALVEALENGALAGAGLDVMEPEPPDPRSPLLARDDVVVTTHVASLTRTAVRTQALAAADSVLAILRGEEPEAESVVNPAVLPCRRGQGISLLAERS